MPLFTSKLFSCVDIASCTLVKHLGSPAAWLQITDCSLAALSQRLNMSWLRAREDGAVGRLCLATLLNALLSFAGSGDHEHSRCTRVLLVNMHVVLSRRPWCFNKLVPEQSSSFCASGRVAFSNSEV